MTFARHEFSRRLFTALAAMLCVTLVVSLQPARADDGAKTPAQPSPQTIRLWPTGAPHPDRPADAKPLDPKSPITRDEPTLTVYLPNQPASGAALVICPGGGYSGLAMDHEGHDVARYFQARGVAGFVLKYRMPRAKVPGTAHGVPLADAQRALRLVRSKAEEWHIDPAKVGIMGFSAGGHLASTADTHFDRGHAESDDPVAKFSCRPDFAVLIYPVISSDPKIWHGGSFNNLLGPKPDPKLLANYCNDKQVTADTPPTLLFHAQDDHGVPVENSERFFDALRKAKVPTEMHLFERGGHGFGMRVVNDPAMQWPALTLAWMQLHGWVPGKAKK